MTIGELIERLEALRTVAGEDVAVAVPVLGKAHDYEVAIANLQWVIRKPLSDTLWQSRQMDNTHQIVVIR